jgi:outer membrane murein-binding lipoprotein Lpp
MTCRARTFFLSLIVLLCFIYAAGCTSQQTADTNNTTSAVQSYNAWIDQQHAFDGDVRDAITQIGNHIQTYNTEIASDQPDTALMQQNLATDKQLLDRWGSDLEALNTATSQFGQSTASLQYDNTSSTKSVETMGQITQYMKIYGVDMGNARQHLIDYVNNEEAYIGQGDPEYWNAKYLQDAIKAKDQASASIADGDTALENITTQSQVLAQIQ